MTELLTQAQVEEAIGPLKDWDGQCHAASLAIVKAGLLPQARVARGFCAGVGGQHSWVVVGHDCYAETAQVIDPTLWGYDKAVEGLWQGSTRERPHTPHGSGSIWEYGRPVAHGGEIIELEGTFGRAAWAFLELLGPLDLRGWVELAHAPVGGWPAEEIIAAMYDHPKLSARVPIDIAGMVTDHNPGGLYLRDNDDEGANA